MKNILTNQFPVSFLRFKKVLTRAARVIQLQGTAALEEQRGRAKYRDSENVKGVPRIFCGVKIAPLPPGIFPARGGALRRSPTRAWGIVKSAVLIEPPSINSQKHQNLTSVG